jgi:hypothetical protein
MQLRRSLTPSPGACILVLPRRDPPTRSGPEALLLYQRQRRRTVKPNPYAGPRVNVSLTVEDLPLEIAEQVQQAQRRDPELLRRVMVYAVTRNAVFETLNTRLPR